METNNLSKEAKEVLAKIDATLPQVKVALTALKEVEEEASRLNNDDAEKLKDILDERMTKLMAEIDPDHEF